MPVWSWLPRKEIEVRRYSVFHRESLFQDVLAGIDEKVEELANYNCTVITKQISFGVEAQLQTIDELLAEEVNGIAMTPYNDARIRNRINALYEQGIPVVTLNTDIEIPDASLMWAAIIPAVVPLPPGFYS